MSTWKVAAAGALAFAAARVGIAQQPVTQSVTRSAAIASAIERAPRVAVARADSLAARAQLTLARQLENPALALDYTKDPPQYHVAMNLPFNLPGIRNARVAFAQAGLDAAVLRYAYAREAIAYDADTAYTQALAATERARLSRATARGADSILTLARVRRDAGDATELDVQLAAVSAGQLENLAAADSVDAIIAVLNVQSTMGLSANEPTITLTDSLDVGPPGGPSSGTPLLLAAAEQSARAADLGVAAEHRNRFGIPSVSFGFDTHDPGGQGNTILPAIGVSMALPLLNQNGAAIQVAEAERYRAQAELALARITVNASLQQARRAVIVAQQRAARSQQLVDGANRVATMSLLAYREGANTLASVLEAQRQARELLSQYVNDVAAARNAASLAQLLERSASSITTNRPPR